MRKTAVALALAALLITAAGTLPLNFVNANFTPLPDLPPPIYIRSDGSIDPSTASIQHDGDTYKLTSNISNTIEIQRANVVIDGNGFALTKPPIDTEGLMTPVGWLPGIHVVGGSNVTIEKITFDNCVSGIEVKNSADITIRENKIAAATSGIVILSSSNINIIHNNIVLSNQGFATGINLLPSNPEASNPRHIRIEGNIITGTGDGSLWSLPPQPEQYGIWGGFSDSQIIGNVFTRIKGIALYYQGSNNLITGNNFQDNYEGFFFNGASEYSVNSTIYCNNFNQNSRNVVVPNIRNPPLNFWDNGTVGNYWSDYNGADANGDGIGDSPYIIEYVYYNYDLRKNVTMQEGQDNFPLMAPVSVPNPSPSPTPSSSPEIRILSPENTTYSAVYDPYVTVPLTFATDASLSWVGYSLDGGSNVTVTNGTLIEIPAESRSLTLYANDTAGNWAVPQTVYYEIAFNLGPVQEPFPIMPVAAASVAAFVLVGAGLLVYFMKRKQLR